MLRIMVPPLLSIPAHPPQESEQFGTGFKGAEAIDELVFRAIDTDGSCEISLEELRALMGDVPTESVDRLFGWLDVSRAAWGG